MFNRLAKLLRRCDPRADIEATLTEIIARRLQVIASEIDLSWPVLAGPLMTDELDVIQIVTDVESIFNMKLPDDGVFQPGGKETRSDITWHDIARLIRAT